jgi:hypothetical protein
MNKRDRIGAPARSEQTGAQATRFEHRPPKPGLELRGKHPVGRDPRQMTQAELQAAGHEPMSPLRALRARCLDCCGHQEKEVALCPAVDCPSWPFRMGTDPWRKPASEARREAARRTMTDINAKRRRRDSAEPSPSPPGHGTAPALAEGSEAAPIWATAHVDYAPNTELHREEERGATGAVTSLAPACPAGVAQ